jgi:ketosteroid isomerase-like protein
MNKNNNTASLEEQIIEIEKSALERWNNGDPSGYLEISSDDVVYFDPFLEKRLDGIENLTKLYESLRGQIHVDRYELINPKVQTDGNMAVLTFNLYSYEKENIYKWNCTEVYLLEADKNWKIIQTHWSFTKPN